MLRVLGLDWSGFFIMGTNLVTIVEEAKVPMNPYNAAAALSVTRIPLSIVTMFYISKVKIKTTYFVTSTILRFEVPYYDYSLTIYLVLQFFMFSLGAWTVVLRLCLGEDTSTSTFGESLASWITLVGMVMVYVGYSFGMSQVIKANFRCPLERYTAVFTKYFTLFSIYRFAL